MPFWGYRVSVASRHRHVCGGFSTVMLVSGGIHTLVINGSLYSPFRISKDPQRVWAWKVQKTTPKMTIFKVRELLDDRAPSFSQPPKYTHSTGNDDMLIGSHAHVECFLKWGSLKSPTVCFYDKMFFFVWAICNYQIHLSKIISHQLPTVVHSLRRDILVDFCAV